MADVLTPAQRRLNMSRICGKDTKPEMKLRRGLHALGFRFRLHRKDLPGRPDLTFAARRTVIFVHGCFWHGHACPMYRLPATRTEFWETKIGRNRQRDAEAAATLLQNGWRVLTVWECALRGPARLTESSAVEHSVRFLVSTAPDHLEIAGAWVSAYTALQTRRAKKA